MQTLRHDPHPAARWPLPRRARRRQLRDRDRQPGACRGATGEVTVRADSGFYSHKVVGACKKAKVRFSITVRMMGKALHQAFSAIPEKDWTPIPYFLEGAAVAEIAYTPFATHKGSAPCRLIVRRVPPTPGSQLALFTEFSYHAFITDRRGDMLDLEKNHRAHAEVDNAIRDLKYGMGLNHLPSGRFGANAAWLALNAIAHNLVRWTSRIGLQETLVMTKTMRRRYFSLPGRSLLRCASSASDTS